MDIKVFVVIDTDTVRLMETMRILQDFGKVYDAQRAQELFAIHEQENKIDAVFASSSLPNLRENVQNIIKIAATNVYVLGEVNTEQLADLFASGVRDVLAYPLIPAHLGLDQTKVVLSPMLRGIGGRSVDVDFGGRPVTRERTIVICSPKGGTGKTAVAVQLSAALVKLGIENVLIDSDYCGNAARLADVKAVNSIAEFKEERSQAFDRDTLEDKLATNASGIKILPSPLNLLGHVSNAMLIHAMTAYKKYYATVLIDTQAGYSPIVDKMKDYVTDYVIVVHNNRYEMERLQEFLSKMASRGVDFSKVRIVVNQENKTPEFVRHVLARNELEELKIHCLPKTSFDHDELPVFENPKKSEYSRAFRSLLRELGFQNIPVTISPQVQAVHKNSGGSSGGSLISRISRSKWLTLGKGD